MNDKPELTEKKAPEPLPIDPEEVCDWDFDLAERPAPNGSTRLQVSFREVLNDELMIEEPKNLRRGTLGVRIIGGGRDTPAIILDDVFDLE